MKKTNKSNTRNRSIIRKSARNNETSNSAGDEPQTCSFGRRRRCRATTARFVVPCLFVALAMLLVLVTPRRPSAVATGRESIWTRLNRRRRRHHRRSMASSHTRTTTARTETNTTTTTSTSTTPVVAPPVAAAAPSTCVAVLPNRNNDDNNLLWTSLEPSFYPVDSPTLVHKNNNPNSSTLPVGTPTASPNTNNVTDDVVKDHNHHPRRLFSRSRRVSRHRQRFLDRLALLLANSSSSILYSPAVYGRDRDPLDNDNDDNNAASSSTHQHHSKDNTVVDIDNLEAVTRQSDLRLPGRHIHIVTTAALPWFTGTAVNPLLRAAYLHRRLQQINHQQDQEDPSARNNHHSHNNNNSRNNHNRNNPWVTLVIPWLELQEDQQTLYSGRIFDQPLDQEVYIREWLREQAKMPDAAQGLEILFYPARYHPGLGSIFAMGDIMETVLRASDTNSSITTAMTNNVTHGEHDTLIEEEGEDAEHNPDGRQLQQRVLDVCILEEPEHCNWYRAPGDGWTKRFNYVVGIVHTNYKEYAQAHYSGLWTAPAIALMSSAMVRAYCHKVIKLSDALQSFAVEKETTSNVHGVRSNFWQEGLRRRAITTNMARNSNPGTFSSNNATTQVYFIGKLLWAKGLDIMLELEDYYRQYTGEYFALDLYGDGSDRRAIMRAFHGRRNSVNANPREEAALEAEDGDVDEMEEIALTGNVADRHGGGNSTEESSYVMFSAAKQKLKRFRERTRRSTQKKIARLKDSINSVELPQTLHELIRRTPIPATFPGRVDHGELTEYKIFLNPSTSEVLCTTTAEALAMGKFAIIPVHPSNTFFLQFPNCLAYRNKFEFVANLRWALKHDPEPLTEDQARQFTWEAATDRLLDAAAITWRQALERERLGMHKLDERIAWFHNEIGKGSTGDWLRRVLGAGPASHQVKYQRNLLAASGTGDLYDEDDASSEDDDDDEVGLSAKLTRSSFAQAIRETLEDLTTFSLQ